MTIKIKEISKETLEKNGWEYKPQAELYCKKINNCLVFVREPDSVLPFECWIPYFEIVTPDDLIAIANELKKLEAEE